MRKVISALLCMAALTLALTACGKESGGELESLQAENSRLEQQLSQMEEEKAALEEQLQSQTQQPSQEDSAQTGSDQEEENPIDTFYDGVDSDGPTAVLDAVAGCRADAWQAEVQNLARVLKSQLPLPEDQELVDAYVTAAQEQVERMNVMAIYPISDLTLSQQDRVMTSGTLRGVLWAGSRARIWRDTFYQLQAASPDSYTFTFDPSAAQAQLDELLQAG